MKLKNKLTENIFLKVGGIILLVFLLLLALRTPITRWFINNNLSNLSQRYDAQFTIDKISYNELRGIEFQNIKMAPNELDTLLTISNLKAEIRLLPLLIGRLRFESLELRNTKIQFIKKDSTDNFSFLVKNNKSANNQEDTLVNRNYAEQFDILLDAVFGKVPNTIQITDFQTNVVRDSISVIAYIDTLVILNHKFKTKISIHDDSLDKQLVVEGNVNSIDRTASIKIYSGNENKAEMPYMEQATNLKFEFDTLQTQLNKSLFTDTLLTLSGLLKIDGLILNHFRISTKDVLLDKGSIAFALNIGNDFYEVDSTTVLSYNKLQFNPYLKYRPKPTQQISLQIRKENFSAQDFFDSFPKGLFSNLEGIKTEGNLSYHLDFSIDLSKPDSLHFFSEMKRHNFRIKSFGAENLSKISGPFWYTAYEKGVPVKSWKIGGGDPDFIMIENVTELLKTSVLTAEDAGFFGHRGFYLDAFAQSIAKNIKEKRFARGGSTISMQLVKNVYLTRNKTIARKAEEILITWLIENCGLCSKRRMLEVYLNIIEWGPMIYGINEASLFYFDKVPSRLNLAESIFLASIISHPKWFSNSFDNFGNLKSSMQGFYKLVANKMVHRGYISEEQAARLVPNVHLTGSALRYIKKYIPPPEYIDDEPDFGTE